MRKKLVFSLVFLLAALGALAAQDLNAEVLEVNGKVEYSLNGQTWLAARVGNVLTRGVIVSTGFKSTAVLKVGTSTITVKPVTRLSLEEIVKTRGGTQTQLFLSAGRVKVEVVPVVEERVAFTVRSPAATASVRGTGFEFDGFNLLVSHGVVQLGNLWGQNRFVGGGEYSYLEADGSVSIPIAADPQRGLERLDDLMAQVEVETQAQDSGLIVETVVDTEPSVSLPLVFE